MQARLKVLPLAAPAAQFIRLPLQATSARHLVRQYVLLAAWHGLEERLLHSSSSSSSSRTAGSRGDAGTQMKAACTFWHAGLPHQHTRTARTPPLLAAAHLQAQAQLAAKLIHSLHPVQLPAAASLDANNGALQWAGMRPALLRPQVCSALQAMLTAG
jgi:hypothetical protein